MPSLTYHVELPLGMDHCGDGKCGETARAEGQVGVDDGPVLVVPRGSSGVERRPVEPEEYSSCITNGFRNLYLVPVVVTLAGMMTDWLLYKFSSVNGEIDSN